MFDTKIKSIVDSVDDWQFDETMSNEYTSYINVGSDNKRFSIFCTEDHYICKVVPYVYFNRELQTFNRGELKKFKIKASKSEAQIKKELTTRIINKLDFWYWTPVQDFYSKAKLFDSMPFSFESYRYGSGMRLYTEEYNIAIYDGETLRIDDRRDYTVHSATTFPMDCDDVLILDYFQEKIARENLVKDFREAIELNSGTTQYYGSVTITRNYSRLFEVDIQDRIISSKQLTVEQLNILKDYCLDYKKWQLLNTEGDSFFCSPLMSIDTSMEDIMKEFDLTFYYDKSYYDWQKMKPLNASFLAISIEDDKKLSYISHDRMGKFSSCFENDELRVKYAYHTKVGKAIRKVYPHITDDFELKEIAEKVTAIIEAERINFKLVNGTDIRKYYHHEVHLKQQHSLGSSCMKHDRCQKYFDMYVEAENCEMVIAYKGNDDSKIVGRAIVWDNVWFSRSALNVAHTKFMDRIYSISSMYEKAFRNYAKSQDWIYKEKQDFSSHKKFMYRNEEMDSNAKVEIDDVLGSYDHYPYMDTFSYGAHNGNKLINYSNDCYPKQLRSTTGSLQNRY